MLSHSISGELEDIVADVGVRLQEAVQALLELGNRHLFVTVHI